MPVTTKTFLSLTAGDLMTREVLTLRQDMPLREAGRLLHQRQVSGAPVVDAEGICVGELSSADFARWVEQRGNGRQSAAPALPMTCSFQRKHPAPNGGRVTLCTLSPGVCSVQVKQTAAEGKEILVCNQPHCVLADWQVVELEKVPTDEVDQFMTADPVVVSPTTSITRLARLMVDVRIRRIIVVDEGRRPVGIVSGTDILAAVAQRSG